LARREERKPHYSALERGRLLEQLRQHFPDQEIPPPPPPPPSPTKEPKRFFVTMREMVPETYWGYDRESGVWKRRMTERAKESRKRKFEHLISDTGAPNREHIEQGRIPEEEGGGRIYSSSSSSNTSEKEHANLITVVATIHDQHYKQEDDSMDEVDLK
jgi:hypothetical protein